MELKEQHSCSTGEVLRILFICSPSILTQRRRSWRTSPAHNLPLQGEGRRTIPHWQVRGLGTGKTVFLLPPLILQGEGLGWGWKVYFWKFVQRFPKSPLSESVFIMLAVSINSLGQQGPASAVHHGMLVYPIILIVPNNAFYSSVVDGINRFLFSIC